LALADDLAPAGRVETCGDFFIPTHDHGGNATSAIIGQFEVLAFPLAEGNEQAKGDRGDHENQGENEAAP
jgi:hypothetical protein